MLKFILEKCKYIILLAVVSTFLASAATFVWGTTRMITNVVSLIAGLITHEGGHSGVQMIASLDSLLLAIAIYVLFFGEINVPEWLVIKNLDGLKEKLANVIILILAVTFLEHLVEWKDAKETLMFGVSIAAILIALVFYMQHKKNE